MSSSETFVHEGYPGKSRFCFVLKYLAQQKKIKDNGIWDTYLVQRLKLQPMLLIETLKSLPAGLEGKLTEIVIASYAKSKPTFSTNSGL